MSTRIRSLVPSFGAVLLYTLLHYVAFVGVGLGATWALSKIKSTPNLLLGLVLGFALFDLVFYASVTVTGVDVIGEFGWPAVLMGNLIAGLSLMGFLRFTGETAPVSWWTTLGRNELFREGLDHGADRRGDHRAVVPHRRYGTRTALLHTRRTGFGTIPRIG